MSKRVNNKKGNRVVRRDFDRDSGGFRPTKVRAMSSFNFSVFGAQAKLEALIRRMQPSRADAIYKSWTEGRSFLRRMA